MIHIVPCQHNREHPVENSSFQKVNIHTRKHPVYNIGLIYLSTISEKGLKQQARLVSIKNYISDSIICFRSYCIGNKTSKGQGQVCKVYKRAESTKECKEKGGLRYEKMQAKMRTFVANAGNNLAAN